MVLTRIVFKKKFPQPSPATEDLPPISILKPLCGEDPELEKNLEAFFVQDYPVYEVVFACERKEDPALNVVRRLQEKFPALPVKIEIGPTKYGYNPKVNNLIRAYSPARYDLILTGDSDVRPEPDYLRKNVSELLQKNCQLLVNPICGKGDESLGAILENLHLNSLILSGVAFLSIYKNKPAGFGKSMLFRRPDLEKVGGFQALKDFFAEDYVLARKISELPGRCLVSRTILPCITSNRSVKQFINRHGRWAQARRRIANWSYLSEIFTNPIFWGFTYWGVNLFDWASLKFLLLVVLYKIVLDGYQGISTAKSRRLMDYLLVPVKDLLIGIIWFYPLVTDTVYWRGKRLKVTSGTKLKEAGRRKIFGVSVPRMPFKRWLTHVRS